MKKIKDIIRVRRFEHLICFVFLFIFNAGLTQESHSIAVSDLRPGDSIYVITNRKVDTTRKNRHYNHEVEKGVGIKFLKVFLDDSNQVASDLLGYNDFMTEVSTKTSDWLLFVHGDGKTYSESVQRGFDIQNIYNVNVIVFSWPSEVPGLNGLRNLNNSEQNVSRSVGHFSELLSFMEDFRESNKAFEQKANLSMLLHSLGNLHLKKWADSSSQVQKHDIIFDNVVMNSAAVNRKNHEDWVEKINFQKRIYITNNQYDYSLKGLHIYTKHGNQLGEKFKDSTAKNAHYVHFTEAVGFQTPTSNTHTYFIGDIPKESSNIYGFYYDIIHGDEVDFSDSSRFVKSKVGKGYVIIF